MVSRSVLLCLFGLFFVVFSVEVFVVDSPNDYESQYYANAFESSTAVDGVNFSAFDGIYSEYFDFLNGDLDAYDLVIYSPNNDEDDSIFLSVFEDYVRAGGAGLIAGRPEIYRYWENDAYSFLDLLGAISPFAEGSSYYYDYCSINDYYNDGDTTYGFSAEGACSALISGGFIDIDGTFPQYDEYYHLLEYNDDDTSLYCLNLDSEIAEPAVNCLVNEDRDNLSLFSARAMGEGVLYFIQDGDNSFINEHAGFFYVMFNNLLVSLGATVNTDTPATTVLVIAEEDDDDYYNSALRTGGLLTAQVSRGDWNTFHEREWGSYDMVVFTGMGNEFSGSDFAPDDVQYIQQYASRGGVVMMTGYDSYSDEVEELIGAEQEDCSSAGADFDTLDDFPTDKPMCEALLNGGWMDLKGLSPTDFFYDYNGGNDDLDCQVLSADNLGEACLTNTAYDSDVAWWFARTYGDRGGVIVSVPTDRNWGIYTWNVGFYSAAYKNLQMYAGNQGTCSAENQCLVAVQEWSEVTWGIYAPGCISWFSADMPEGEDTVTLKILSGDKSLIIAENVLISDSAYEWPLVFGISPGNLAQIEFSFAVAETMLSDEFVVSNPRNGVVYPCVGPAPFIAE